MTATSRLPVEGPLPALDGATAWLHSEPLTPAALRGRVAVLQFCTFSCINWLRTVPYVRAWAEKYRDVTVIGVHSPEFPFEHDEEAVRSALDGMGIRYPIAIDDDFALWRALDNAYWPALYFVDVDGRIRHRHVGEEGYERSERVIQYLLGESGVRDVDEGLVSVTPDGVHLAADWASLGTPETYTGYARATGFASPGGLRLDRRHVYARPDHLRPHTWALDGAWTVRARSTTLDEPGGRIVARFHARDLNLVVGAHDGTAARVRVRIDGEPPGVARGLDVDEQGDGHVAEPRLYQLVRQQRPISDRIVEITFLDAGVEAYVITFG
ncbi:redoxin family protein [Actinomycetospora straminea]|uniref:Thioredoxin domain-containing protein n=1 Tax=Actinomycetospora straminea TaxID=663607 RepID=A0ABP9EGP6_9PSEU|nr:redoxin family protein [Actinomycetospora straminea]MDD7935691.1 hypothetical protein [Actinomycetospora straminea]